MPAQPNNNFQALPKKESTRLGQFLWNGKRNTEWQPMQALVLANPEQNSSHTDSISIGFGRYVEVDGDSVLVERLLFGNIAKQLYSSGIEYAKAGYINTGIYTEYTQLYGGDEVTSSILFIDSEQHYLTVTAYNPATQEISGTFQVSYLGFYADIVRFTNGDFHTKIMPVK